MDFWQRKIGGVAVVMAAVLVFVVVNLMLFGQNEGGTPASDMTGNEENISQDVQSIFSVENSDETKAEIEVETEIENQDETDDADSGNGNTSDNEENDRNNSTSGR